jgi:hypothetical protein
MNGIAYLNKGAGRVLTADETRERSRAAFNLWRQADYIAPECHAAIYLRARGVGWLAAKRFRDVIRWMPHALHPSGLSLPAVFLAVTDTNEAFRAVHRLFLNRERAEKFGAPLSYGPIAGNAIKLATTGQVTAAGALVIGEGLETTASACTLLRLPGWCGVAAGNIGKSLVLPAEFRCVTIAVDRDVPGERAAKAAAQRWRAEGREVWFAMPDRDGNDCNDVLKQRIVFSG